MVDENRTLERYHLDGHYNLKGQWWIPSDPERKTTGNLELKGYDGAYLEVEIAFSTEADRNTLTNYPVLVGVTHSGIEVTLRNCQQTEKPLLLSTGSRYHIELVFIGRHFQRPGQIKFRAVYLWLHNFDEWLNSSGFTLPTSFNREEMHIEYCRPKDVELHANASRRLSAGFSVYGPKYTTVQKSIELRQAAYLKVERKSGKDLRDYMATSRTVQTFLALAIRGTVYPRKVMAVYRDERTTIDVFFVPTLRPESSLTSLVDMVFSYPDVSSEIDSMMNLWFRKWPRLEPLCNIYLGVLYGKELYMENRFLGMVQILETYHRRFIGGQYQNKEEFEKSVYPALVEAIPDHINREYRDSLKGKISFAHEYSLRKRLRDLIRRVPETIKGEIFGDANEAEGRFVEKVVATRNYLTHYTKELESVAVTGEKLYWFYVKLRIMSETMFLREMGIPPKRIERFLMKNDGYRQEFRSCRDI